MKRFHVHLHVDELAKSIDFCERLLAAAPSREHFHTLGSIPVFKEASAATRPASACCAPPARPGSPAAALGCRLLQLLALPLETMGRAALHDALLGIGRH